MQLFIHKKSQETNEIIIFASYTLDIKLIIEKVFFYLDMMASTSFMDTYGEADVFFTSFYGSSSYESTTSFIFFLRSCIFVKHPTNEKKRSENKKVYTRWLETSYIRAGVWVTMEGQKGNPLVHISILAVINLFWRKKHYAVITVSVHDELWE